jgi:hypothetical protein
MPWRWTWAPMVPTARNRRAVSGIRWCGCRDNPAHPAASVTKSFGLPSLPGPGLGLASSSGPVGGRSAGRSAGGPHPKPRVRDPERFLSEGSGRGGGHRLRGHGHKAVRLTPPRRLRPLAHGRGAADRSGLPASGCRTENQSFAGTPNPATASRGLPRVSAARRSRVFRYTARDDPLRC